MLLMMLSLLTPTVDVVVVNRIPFSLRGVLKYCNFKEYSIVFYYCNLFGDVLFLRWDAIIVFGHHRVKAKNTL